MALKPYEGQYLKYPQLCEIIGEEKRTGRGKTLHMNRIQQYVDCHQEKGKIYIGRVYSDDDELQIVVRDSASCWRDSSSQRRRNISCRRHDESYFKNFKGGAD